MKRKKGLLLATLAAVLLLSACSGGNGGGNASESADSGGASSPAESGKKTKVVLLVPGNLGDKSFFDAANRGMDLLKEQLGAETKVIEMGTDKTKWEPTVNDIASQDWDFILSGGADITEVFNAAAEAYPDKKFIDYDTENPEVPDNVYAMSYATNEVSFLAGAVAALTTKSSMPQANPDNVIGFLGGMDIPGINTFLVGYIEGAKYVDPDVKVAVSYAGSFSDPAKGKELSLVEYNSGVDVIFNVAGGTGLGVFDAAKEKKQYAIGVDSDQAMLMKDSDSEKANLIVTSAIKKIDTAILGAVKKGQEGTLPYGTLERMGFEQDGVGLADNEIYKSVFPADLQAKIEDIKKKLAAKEITVTDASAMETSKVEEIRNSVKP